VTHLVAAGGGVAPRLLLPEPPGRAGSEDVGLRGPPHRYRPLRARLAGARPRLLLAVINIGNPRPRCRLTLHIYIHICNTLRIFRLAVTRIIHCCRKNRRYLWPVPTQLGMLERGLKVRRHAVDDVAVRALGRNTR
jgi:hypothetical protein